MEVILHAECVLKPWTEAYPMSRNDRVANGTIALAETHVKNDLFFQTNIYPENKH